MSYRVVFTDHTFDDLSIEREILAAVDAEVVDAEARDEPLSDLVTDADGLLVMFADIDEAFIDTLEDCQVISRTGIGVDNVAVEAATAAGIRVTNVPDYCFEEVTAHTLALLLALDRNILTYNSSVHDGEWDVTNGNPMTRSSEQTLGLVAFGNIAKRVADAAAGLGMAVLVHDPHVDDSEIAAAGATPVADLHDLLSRADFVSTHTPLIPETRGLIGPEELDVMQESAYLLNTARGGIVDEQALATALDEGEIAGAGIDVLETEPPADDHPLLGRDDVILTPHAAWKSEDSVRELRQKAAENVRSVLAGEEPPYLINEGVTGR